MAIIKQSLIVLVLLICGAGGSTTPAPEPALLTQDNLCVGIRSVPTFLQFIHFREGT